MATLGFMDNDGVDLGNKYITKDYVMTWYPNLPSGMVAPQLWGWGYNVYGALGDNTTVDKSSPIQTIAGGSNWKQISTGVGSSAAIKTDGTLWVWGQNSYGALGDNTTVHKSSPIQTIAGGSNWKQVACAYSRTSAIKTDGTLWSCGYNTRGQLGDGTTLGRSSPVQTITGGTNWLFVACSGHTAAIKTDGTLWMWGDCSYGQLGDNTIAHKSSPIQTTAGGTNWKTVACGAMHTAAIKIDGTLWVWGSNAQGQLGDTTTATHRSSPIQTVAGGTNWKTVACGFYHTVAIKTDGTLWAWGNNSQGQLGTGSTSRTLSPVQTVLGGTNWKVADCGMYHTAAIKIDGSLWTWGYNPFGQLGNNLTDNTSTPAQTVAGGSNWKSVVCGSRWNTLALSEASGW